MILSTLGENHLSLVLQLYFVCWSMNKGWKRCALSGADWLEGLSGGSPLAPEPCPCSPPAACAPRDAACRGEPALPLLPRLRARPAPQHVASSHECHGHELSAREQSTPEQR